MFWCPFFEFWRVGILFLIIFSEDFSKLSLTPARDNKNAFFARAGPPGGPTFTGPDYFHIFLFFFYKKLAKKSIGAPKKGPIGGSFCRNTQDVVSIFFRRAGAARARRRSGPAGGEAVAGPALSARTERSKKLEKKISKNMVFDPSRASRAPQELQNII